jgi:hypothetical protein
MGIVATRPAWGGGAARFVGRLTVTVTSFATASRSTIPVLQALLPGNVYQTHGPI